MRIRYASTGEICNCDYGDVMGYRNNDQEHFHNCPFADPEQVIDKALCAERLDLVEIITDN